MFILHDVLPFVYEKLSKHAIYDNNHDNFTVNLRYIPSTTFRLGIITVISLYTVTEVQIETLRDFNTASLYFASSNFIVKYLLSWHSFY